MLPECVEGADEVHSKEDMVNDEDERWLRLAVTQPLGKMYCANP